MGNAWPEVARRSKFTAVLLSMFGRVLARGVANAAQVVVSTASR